MRKGKTIAVLLFLFVITVSAQKQGNIWCFGHNAGVDFNTSPPKPLLGILMNTGESSSSIADKYGNLILYAGAIRNNTINNICIRNNTNSIIKNGDTIKGGESDTQDAIFIQFQSDTNKYFYISRGYEMFETIPWKFYYSVINMSKDSGQGEVIIKNQIFYDKKNLTEKLLAVRHANGNDWWLLMHDRGTNNFVKFLIRNDSVLGPFIQSIGTIYFDGSGYMVAGQMCLSPDGNRIVAVTPTAILDVFDFNRCTGELSNWVYLGIPPHDTYKNPNGFYGCAFSPNSKLLYISDYAGYDNITNLFQYNLTASDITSSRTLLWSDTLQVDFSSKGGHQICQLKLAPNNKIYIATSKSPLSSIPDSINKYLSVINNPDSVGVSCDLQKYSFYLAGNYCYCGLPNIPNYTLGKLPPCCNITIDTLLAEGDSINIQNVWQKKTGTYIDTIASYWGCDSVVVTNLTVITGEKLLITQGDNNQLLINPNPATSIIQVDPPTNTGTLQITDLNGKVVLTMPIKELKENVNVIALPQGLYFVRAVTGGGVYNGRFVKIAE